MIKGINNLTFGVTVP